MHGLGHRPPRPEITAPTSDKPIQLHTRVHRTRFLPAADVCAVGGIATTTVPRTLLDVGAVLRFEVVEAMSHDALIRKATSLASLAAVLDRTGKRGRAGTATLRAVVRQSAPDERLESELERRLLALIEQVTSDAAIPQYEFALLDGSIVRLDFAWPARRLAVEADGRRWHASATAFRRDLARSRAIQARGWAHHRFGWSDVVEAPSTVLRELKALLA
jgi:very-short-patch-repair endonuclease